MKLVRMLPYVRQGTVVETEVYCYFNYNYYVYIFCSSGRLLSLPAQALSINVNSTHGNNCEGLFVTRRVISRSFHSHRSVLAVFKEKLIVQFL
jgi:hypothetical protein